MMNALLFILGLVVLIKGADLLVKGASTLARQCAFVFGSSGVEHQSYGWHHFAVLLLPVYAVCVQNFKN